MTRGIRTQLLIGAVSTRKGAKEDLEEVWEHPWVTGGRLDATLSWHSHLRILTVTREKITRWSIKVTSLDLGRGCSNTGQVLLPACAVLCRIRVQWWHRMVVAEVALPIDWHVTYFLPSDWCSNRTQQIGAWEMAQSVKLLIGKYEGLSLESQHRCKTSGMTAHR